MGTPSDLHGGTEMSAARRIGTLAQLLGAVVLAGVLVAAVLFPVVGGIGVTARDSASLLDALPVELTDRTPPGNTVVLAANGEVITGFYDENRAPVTADRIAPVMKQAMVAIEDARFYSHNGLDVQGTLRAAVTNLVAGDVQEGGSTLTQQLVKQTLLQTAETPEEAAAATEQTLQRKLREARLALALEETYTKDEILTRYLNIVYFGQNAYGVQAAARIYFSVDAVDLTLPQAAMLAGLAQSPTSDDPTVAPDAATTRRNQVLDRMAAQGMVSPADAAAAQAAPLGLVLGAAPPRGCVQASVGAFVCDFVQRYLTQTLGISQDQLEHDGLTIQTTLDPELQRAGDAAVLQTLPMGDSLAGLFTAVQPGTGHLLAMSVNRVFGYDPADPAQESYNLNVAASQGSGSTYKVFTAAAALARQYSQYYTLTTGDPYVSRVYRDGSEPYDVRNAGRYSATLDLSTALYQSSNTYFLALEDALGSVEEPVRMAEAAGLFQFSDPGLPQQIIDENRGSFTFGAEATSPLALASAYSTFAASGTRCLVTPVTAVLDRTGAPLTGTTGPRWCAATSARRVRSTPAWPPPSTRSCAATSSPGTPARPGRAPTSPATRSPARPGRRRTTSPPPSSAPPPRSPPASWCSTPSRTRTSAASAATSRPPSGGRRWRRSWRPGAAGSSRPPTPWWSTATPARCPAAGRCPPAAPPWPRPGSSPRP